MAYDAPDDLPEHKWLKIMTGAMTITIETPERLREDVFKKQAAAMILRGVVAPDLIKQLTE